MKPESPKLMGQRGGPLVIAGTDKQNVRQVPVQTFLNAFGGEFESIAYIEDERTLSLVVLSSASEALMRRDYPAL